MGPLEIRGLEMKLTMPGRVKSELADGGSEVIEGTEVIKMETEVIEMGDRI